MNLVNWRQTIERFCVGAPNTAFELIDLCTHDWKRLEFSEFRPLAHLIDVREYSTAALMSESTIIFELYILND